MCRPPARPALRSNLACKHHTCNITTKTLHPRQSRQSLSTSALCHLESNSGLILFDFSFCCKPFIQPTAHLQPTREMLGTAAPNFTQKTLFDVSPATLPLPRPQSPTSPPSRSPACHHQPDGPIGPAALLRHGPIFRKRQSIPSCYGATDMLAQPAHQANCNAHRKVVQETAAAQSTWPMSECESTNLQSISPTTWFRRRADRRATVHRRWAVLLPYWEPISVAWTLMAPATSQPNRMLHGNLVRADKNP